ncbi:MAG TPA: hypothetical protein VJT13_24415 [Xanthobacteraceae bacterium]|nr:hypothetical protein [Xanthobacteraceae bacterium]
MPALRTLFVRDCNASEPILRPLRFAKDCFVHSAFTQIDCGVTRVTFTSSFTLGATSVEFS